MRAPGIRGRRLRANRACLWASIDLKKGPFRELDATSRALQNAVEGCLPNDAIDGVANGKDDMSIADDATDANRLSRAAAEKIKGIRFCWLITADDGSLRPRPMGRIPRDPDEDEWTLRFITDGNSPKVADIRRDDQVSVVFQHAAEDVYVALTGKASLAEGKPEIRRRWTTAYDSFFPDGPDRSSAIFLTVAVARVELWIRGATPEPFGLRTTIIERDAADGWRLHGG